MKVDSNVQARIDAMFASAGDRFSGALQLQMRADLGRARAAEECERLVDLRRRSSVPDGVGPGVHDCAPARGPAQLFRPEEAHATETGTVYRRMTAPGEAALRMADAFDVMQEQASRRAKSRGRDAGPLFSPAQIAAGRTYAALYERVASVGGKGISVEVLAASSGGGQSGGFIEAYLRDAGRLRRMVAAIGEGWAIAPKNAGPHGDRRRAVRIADLVNRVCVGGQTLSDVLKGYGWSPQTKHREVLRGALADALDRLYAH